MSVRRRLGVPRGSLPPAGPDPCARPAVVPHDVKKAIEHMRARMDQKVTIADLVRASGVPERTLHKHFRAFVGLSPLGYLRRMRLAAVRQELLAGVENDSVTEIAARYGFSHLGRFSTQYRQCFREPPSSTLHRALRNSSTCPDSTAEISRALRTSRDRPCVAILPFHTTTIDQRFFAESLAEGIACALSRVRSLSVTTLRSPPNVSSVDRQRLARECGARYGIAGSITQSRDQLRAIVRLLDTSTGQHLWGDSYDGEMADLFGLQDRVTEGVVRSILPNVRGAEIERARRKPAEDLDAYDLTLRALPLAFATNPDAAKQALDLLAHAMDIGPDYALPVAMAAWCHAQLVTYNGTRSMPEEKAHAVHLANRAAALDTDGDPLVVTARCAVHTMVNDLDTGAALLERALALDPTSAWAWERSGWLKTYFGQSELAIRHFEHSIRLAPADSPMAHRFIGIGSAYFEAGRYEKAVRWKQRAVLEQPGTAWVNRTLAVSYARLGDRLAALDSLDALRRYCPDVTTSQVVSAVPFTCDFLNRVAESLDDLGLPP
jgi:adenylate cyclase